MMMGLSPLHFRGYISFFPFPCQSSVISSLLWTHLNRTTAAFQVLRKDENSMQKDIQKSCCYSKGPRT